jgi:hypothetical protein
MKENKEREVDEEIYVGTTTKVIYTPACRYFNID